MGLVGSPSMWDAADAKTDPIGTGPYELDQAKTVVGSTYVYEKRDDYWDADSVHYDEIVVTVYSDAHALVNALKGGQVECRRHTPRRRSPTRKTDTANPIELNWAGFLLVDRDGTINPADGDVRVRELD